MPTADRGERRPLVRCARPIASRPASSESIASHSPLAGLGWRRRARATIGCWSTRSSRDGKLTVVREIDLDGRPVALANARRSFRRARTPLRRPEARRAGLVGDFRSGRQRRAGGRTLAGYYPDDLAVSPDGRYLLLLSSGQAEGDPKKPLPALEVVLPDFSAGTSRMVGRLVFDATDDPARLSLSASGRAPRSCWPSRITLSRSICQHPSFPRHRSHQAFRRRCALSFALGRSRLDHDAGRLAI